MSRTEQGRAARKQGVDHEPAPHRSSKDTKRWCLGKVGREHEPTWVLSKHDRVSSLPRRRAPWLTWTCTKCGKELDRCWPWHFEPDRPTTKPCPRGCRNRHKVNP